MEEYEVPILTNEIEKHETVSSQIERETLLFSQ